MLNRVRAVGLLAGAICSVLVPCFPTLAFASVCTMPGCDDAPYGAITSADCCCAAPPAQAEHTSPTRLTAASFLVAASTPGDGGRHAPGHGAAPLDAFIEPATPVPLYLLHASLLI